MSSETKHTPLPWRYSPFGVNIIGANGEFVGMVRNGHSAAMSEPDAKLIIRAVNSHDELVEALREALKPEHHWHGKGCAAADMTKQCDCWISKARAALAKADKGVQP